MAGPGTNKIGQPHQAASLHSDYGNHKMLAFVHIEKCAGTTFKGVLQRNFGVAFCDVRPLLVAAKKAFDSNAALAYSDIIQGGANPNVFGPGDLETYRYFIPWMNCIAGHSIRPCLGLQTIYPRISYVTILREPTSRYVSYYTYGTGNPRIAWPFSFEEYLEKPHFYDFQTKKLACQADLDLAVRSLEKSFMLVGTMDAFDEFLVMLKRKLNVRRFDIGYQSLNVQKSEAIDLTDQFGEKIRENNRLDIELYRYVQENILPRQRAAFGPDLEEAVADFKIENAARQWKRSLRQPLQKLFQRIYYDTASGIIRHRNGLPWGGPY